MGVKFWPQWSESFIKKGFPESSLLAGTEPAVWDALGRLELKDFNNGKQVAVRKALDDIGLGWVATNTTPFRIAVGGLFDAAKWYHRDIAQNAGSAPPTTQSANKTAPAIEVTTCVLPESDNPITGPITKSASTHAQRRALWHQLETYGACVIRNAVPASTLNQSPDTTTAKETKLARTMGNGVAGDPPSVYMDITQAPDWHDALEQHLGELLMGPGAPEEFSKPDATLNRKSILLLAGEGAENWAHQDNNDETPPVQAVLLLSAPEEDFTGGEFYVAKQTGNTDTRISVTRYELPFSSPGDLVIFKAGKNSGWWHGMLPVKAGHNRKQGHLRKAVGMLQPPA
jgi:hypothetical protein